MMTEIREAGVHYLLNLMIEGCAFLSQAGMNEAAVWPEGLARKDHGIF